MDFDEKEKYERWWLNKYCRFPGSKGPFRRITKIKLYGPPSFVYGSVEVFFEGDDGGTMVPQGEAYKPQKWRIEVSPNNGINQTPKTSAQ